jgi:hypothetical protein
MKRFVLLLPAVFALGALSCEKHPLPGEPPAPLTYEARPTDAASPASGEQHPGGVSANAKEARDEGAQPAQQSTAPAEGGKPAEPRKFFPESSEKK